METWDKSVFLFCFVHVLLYFNSDPFYISQLDRKGKNVYDHPYSGNSPHHFFVSVFVAIHDNILCPIPTHVL